MLIIFYMVPADHSSSEGSRTAVISDHIIVLKIVAYPDFKISFNDILVPMESMCGWYV